VHCCIAPSHHTSLVTFIYVNQPVLIWLLVPTSLRKSSQMRVLPSAGLAMLLFATKPCGLAYLLRSF
jgi:hypothetical protein